MTDEEFMGKWFSEVTKPQLARYNERMAVASAYRGAPRWTREREAADREYDETTAEARRLYELAMADLLALGEVSEDTDALLTQFKVGEIMAENPLAAEAADLAVITKVLERA
jgi:hypothetical protein